MLYLPPENFNDRFMTILNDYKLKNLIIVFCNQPVIARIQ